MDSSKIRIVAINAIDGVFLDRLALCLEERFLFTARVDRALAVPRSALNNTRQQLFVATLVSKILRGFPDNDGVLLAVTDFDLYKTSHRFIFGHADEHQAVAVISLHRLRSEFYGEESDENTVFQRALKEATHEIGHIRGLKHCFNARCAMYYSNSIYETDNKMPHFCEICEKRLSRTRKET